MNAVAAGDSHTREHSTHPDKRAEPTYLGIDGLVESFVAILARAGVPTIQTVVPDRTVRVVANQEEMVKAFDTVVRLVARSASVTILGGVVPIEAGEENEGSGCAFLSISIPTEQLAESGLSGEALAALGRIIRSDRGSFRLRRQRGEMRFSLYLPVLHGA